MFIQNDVAEQAPFLLSQSGGNINEHWILIDSQSIVDVFCNIRLLSNVRTVNEGLTIHCNAMIARINQVGEMKGYGIVWYYSDGIANIYCHYIRWQINNTYSTTATKAIPSQCGKMTAHRECLAPAAMVYTTVISRVSMELYWQVSMGHQL